MSGSGLSLWELSGIGVSSLDLPLEGLLLDGLVSAFRVPFYSFVFWHHKFFRLVIPSIQWSIMVRRRLRIR